METTTNLHIAGQMPLLPNNTVFPRMAAMPQERTWGDIFTLPVDEQIQPETTTPPKNLPFIEANTKEVTLEHLRDDCIIPVFSKDNEVTISHQSFIETVLDAAYEVFPREQFSGTSIRASHVVKGRIPEALHKPVNQLLDSDKTIYYERMMFCFEIPTIYQDIAGNRLNLTIGGVRAYNQENLYSKKTAEKFKVFIGFKNMVCCNLCVSTDGYSACLKAMELAGLLKSAIELFKGYDMEKHLRDMQAYQQYAMSESQFAQFLGRTRLYQYLPSTQKKLIPQLLMTDTQIGLVAKSYYDDKDFGRGESRDISMWQVYNLFTGANKSSYIDNFLDRSLNASQFIEGLCKALQGDEEYAWFIS